MTAPAVRQRSHSGRAPLPSLLSVAWPLFVEQGLRTLILTVDTFMVSHVSDGAVAAVGVATQVLVLCIILFSFVGIGSAVVVTHHLGAGDRGGARRIAGAAMGVNTAFGVLVSVAVVGSAPLLLRLLQLPPELRVHARPFLTILGGTLFLEAQSVAMAAVLRAHARTRETMLVTGGQNILNVVGNCILLFGLLGFPRLGVTGVAISGALARVVGFAALRVLLARRTGIHFGWRDYFSFPVREVGRILHIGLPAAGEVLSYWLALICVTSFAARLGERPIAVFTYTRNLQTWVVLFALSVGAGTEIVVGHLVGAGAFEEVYRRLLRSLRTGLLLVGGATLVLFAAGRWALRAFTSDPVVLKGCSALLVIELVLEPGRVFNVVVINSLRATGDARFPVLMGASSMWLLWVPLAAVLALATPLGVTGIWLAMACDEWLRGVIMYRRWLRRGWLDHARRSHETVLALAVPGDEGAA
ncbi:MAG TPA: MATE family efflux transporter [Anaeromyxobacter sp.]|nr:MATE family efflux transporter [Anaeromyxobacter sp.]